MKPIKKVLIAEDELIVARVLKLMLEKKNFQVTHVSEGEQAISVSKELNPDLIILDVYLKNKSSGIKAGEQIRKNGNNSPIVFTTGNSYDQTKDAIKDISNSHLFIKPVDVEQLIRYLELNF